MMDNYLKETRMLNYKAKSLEELVRSRNWKELDEFERIGAIYDYVVSLKHMPYPYRI